MNAKQKRWHCSVLLFKLFVGNEGTQFGRMKAPNEEHQIEDTIQLRSFRSLLKNI